MVNNFINKSKVILLVALRTIITVYRISPIFLISILVCTISKGGAPLLFIYLTEKTISALISDLNNSTLTITPFFFIFMQFIYYIALEILNYLDKIISLRLSQKLEYYFNNEVFFICANSPLIYYDDVNYYNSLERSTLGIGKNSFSYLQQILSFLQSIITFVSFIIALYSIHWSISFFLFFTVSILIWVNIYTSKSNYDQFILQILSKRKIEYIESLFKSKEAAKEFRIFNHAPYMIKKWKETFWDVSNQQYKLEKTNNKKVLWVDFLQLSLNYLFLGLIGFYALTKKITISKFVALSQILSSSINISYQIASALGRLFRESLSINDYYEFKTQIPTEKMTSSVDAKIKEFKSLEVRNISFSYPNHNHLVLDNISFNINPGDKVAIVGRNGSGKSTLVKCMTGLYLPTGGAVLLNDIPITKEIRGEMFSTVFQDFLKYEMSILENITLDKEENPEIISRLMKVMQSSSSNQLLDKYNLTYSDNIGATLFGRELSGGEWQKISLSRALFKDSPIIILDEPTAALDPVSETRIIEQFLDISKEKTSIFVTHRLGSCINADVILVLKDGKLIEQGTHDELMLLNGEYKELFHMQSKWYKEKVNI
ncbi:ABC transporter ATP-binding protein [Bacillus thuringiensis]|uniref:ABC transporter ATP-binding protein n=1 Tax=Bacillus thuringiensis TaxID=1428 RepID=UPI000CD91BB3|nr:ABC transporter ATP-binding protein [Bacillus thuringiensis]QFQ28543.1 ABC transporter ATP-binding protein [Bacillus thuringiensis]